MEFTNEQKTYAEIVQKAWESPEFKAELTANPVEAIEKLTGQKLNLPEGKTIVVRDQTDETTVFINIPAQTKSTDDMELNEEQLEMAAGGVIDGPSGGCIPNPFPGGTIFNPPVFTFS
jgi:hypothetical protein